MHVTWLIALILTTVVTISGQRSGWPWARYGGMRNPRCISCSEVKEAYLCETCCKRSACTPNPCKHNGACSIVDNGYSCSCTPGYLGEHCDVNVCLPNPCKNNGTCSPVDKGYSCNCVTGYLGENCDGSACTPNPCKHNGACSIVDNGYSCSCTPGYLGEHCDVNVCLPNPCKNNGTCSPVDKGYSCNCVTGYLGENCDVRECNVTECRGTCIIQRCKSDANNCSGKICSGFNEVCIDDNCVNRGGNCGTIDGIYNACGFKGESCGGDGEFCSGIDKCVNDTCRPRNACKNGDCFYNSVFGICSGGACLVTCVEDKDCRGNPCIGGYCAFVKCGESYCAL
ncbi:adhesive plaque matrix protein 2 isoform X1 [Patella vulgata]|uniref:adhesive plaque matrix protein 2 isoform X1 n=1 Tax=Patella vulgata TaxID=6465 RepID=UPI0024A83B6D|nr:adhesive plaque matrix protein 2 isoform X1 [Patella vulgata]